METQIKTQKKDIYLKLLLGIFLLLMLVDYGNSTEIQPTINLNNVKPNINFDTDYSFLDFVMTNYEEVVLSFNNQSLVIKFENQSLNIIALNNNYNNKIMNRNSIKRLELNFDEKQINYLINNYNNITYIDKIKFIINMDLGLEDRMLLSGYLFNQIQTERIK